MRIAVRYSGRVQGVGFRATARAVAARHPVTGWVRNEPDGSVSLEVQGAPEHVRGVLDDIHRSMGRLIHAADHADIPDLTGETAFVIRR